ncbi:hypothetical protein ACLOJK_028156 [Asimina triloba]
MKSGSSILLLFVSLISLAFAQTHPFLRPPRPLPSRKSAEKLIRSLNLIPGTPEIEPEIDLSGPRLVEKKLDLEILGDSGASLEELGHHAGYYRLEHAHAARLLNALVFRRI